MQSLNLMSGIFLKYSWYFVGVLKSWEKKNSSDFPSGFILMAKMLVCYSKHDVQTLYFSLYPNSTL